MFNFDFLLNALCLYTAQNCSLGLFDQRETYYDAVPLKLAVKFHADDHVDSSCCKLVT